jgi:hypothetical protein
MNAAGVRSKENTNRVLACGTTTENARVQTCKIANKTVVAKTVTPTNVRVVGAKAVSVAAKVVAPANTRVRVGTNAKIAATAKTVTPANVRVVGAAKTVAPANASVRAGTNAKTTATVAAAKTTQAKASVNVKTAATGRTTAKATAVPKKTSTKRKSAAAASCSAFGESLNQPSLAERPPFSMDNYSDCPNELSVLRKMVAVSMQQRMLPGMKTLVAREFRNNMARKREPMRSGNGGADRLLTWPPSECELDDGRCATRRNVPGAVNTCTLLAAGAMKTRVMDAYNQVNAAPVVRAPGKKMANSYVNRKTKLSETTRNNNLMIKKILDAKSTLPPPRLRK